VGAVDLLRAGRLEFEAVDASRFPAIELGPRAIRAGGTAGAILNAANEAAVEAFLSPGSDMPFGLIADLAAGALDEVRVAPLRTLGDVMEADAAARDFVRREVSRRAGGRVGPPTMGP
jgi:1-deoxy-D-xylulose-5-phosphate reductoisomerase